MSKVTNWPMIMVAYLTLFSLGLLDNARGPYFPDITADLDLSDTQASLFFATTSAVGFFSGRIVPRLVDRFGLMNVVRMGHLLLGLGFFSITLANSLPTLVLTCAVFGYGFGLINVVQNLLILEGAHGQLRRRLLSGLHGMYAVASLVAPLLAALLFRLGIGWRQAYVGFACIVSISFLSSFFTPTPTVRSRFQGEPSGAGPVKSPWALAAMMSFYVLGELALSTRLTLYLRRTLGYSPDDAAALLAVFFLLLLVGRFVFLAFPTRLTNIQVIEGSLIGSVIFYLLGLWVHPAFLTGCGLTMAPIFALSLDLIAELYAEHSSQIMAHCLAVSCLYIVSMHFIMGVLTDAIGIDRAMYFGVVALFASWGLLRRIKVTQLRGR